MILSEFNYTMLGADRAIRWLKDFDDKLSRFDTIPDRDGQQTALVNSRCTVLYSINVMIIGDIADTCYSVICLSVWLSRLCIVLNYSRRYRHDFCAYDSPTTLGSGALYNKPIPRFLAEYRKRRLNQCSFVLRCFPFSRLCLWLFFLICLLSSVNQREWYSKIA